MNNKTVKILIILSFLLSIISLIIGASFHDFRMHPDNVENYNLGVLMGILMISLFVVFVVIGIGLLIYKRKKK